MCDIHDNVLFNKIYILRGALVFKILWSFLVIGSMICGAARENAPVLKDSSFERLQVRLEKRFGVEACRQSFESLEDCDNKIETIEQDFKDGKTTLDWMTKYLLLCEIPRFFFIFHNQFVDQRIVESCHAQLKKLAGNSDVFIYDRIISWFMLDQLAFKADYENKELSSIVDEVYCSLNDDSSTKEGFHIGRNGVLSDYLERSKDADFGHILMNELFYRTARRNYMKGKMASALCVFTPLELHCDEPTLVADIQTLRGRIPSLKQDRKHTQVTYQKIGEQLKDKYPKQEQKDPDDKHLKKLKALLNRFPRFEK